MTHKDKELVIAALEEYKGDCTGIIAATIEDCQRVIGEMAEDDGWIPVTERLPTEEEWLEAQNSSFLCLVHIPVPGGVANERMMVIPYTPYNGWECEGVIIVHWMPLPEPPREGT